MPDILVRPSGELLYGPYCFSCVLGKNGVTTMKREGDLATPIGRFPLRQGFYRPDRVSTPTSILPFRALEPNDGWCDDPSIPEHYNKYVRHPFSGSAERMWREDHCYDIVIMLGYNDAPAVPGLGSAIFLHVAKPDFSPTEGCIALALDDLKTLLADVQAGDALVVSAPEAG